MSQTEDSLTITFDTNTVVNTISIGIVNICLIKDNNLIFQVHTSSVHLSYVTQYLSTIEIYITMTVQHKQTNKKIAKFSILHTSLIALNLVLFYFITV
jgi:hypothetical protein